MINKKKIMMVATVTVFSMMSMLSSATAINAQDSQTQDANGATLPLATTKDVKINDENNFPDATFRNYVASFDESKNGTLEKEEIEKVTTINVRAKSGIKDLKGIEFFTKLNTLFCESTGITSLNVDKNTELTSLNCNYTKITSLELDKNIKLQSLECSYTKITSLKLGMNKGLGYLACNNTKITSLDVRENPKLTYVNISDNALTSLDIGENKNLEIRNSQSKEVVQEGIVDTFNMNDIQDGIELSKVTIISGGTLDPATGIVSGFERGKTNITYTYNCGEAKGVPVKLNVTIMPIETVKVGINEKNFPDATFRNYVTSFDKDEDGILEYAEIEEVTEINVSGYPEIKNLKGIEFFTKLKELFCYDTGITSLNVDKNTALTTLFCHNTKITSLKLDKNIELKYLTCSNTKITSLDVSGNINLQSMDISDNALTSLDIGTKTNLEIRNRQSKEVVQEGIENTFNMYNIQTDIDLKKVDNFTGGTLDKDTGIVSGFKRGTAITYTYNCGEANGVPVKLNVTIMPTKFESTIIVNKDLNKVYDGKKVSLTKNDITVTGSTGDISYEWFIIYEDNTGWDKISDAPVDVGSYVVQIYVEEDDMYREAYIEIAFDIKKADNSQNVTNTKGGSVKTGVTDQTGTFAILGVLSLGIIVFMMNKKRIHK